MNERIAFLGLGSMGFPMARRLLDAGCALTVYNRTRARAVDLLAESSNAPNGADVAGPPGVVIAEQPADAARGLGEGGAAAIAVTMLSDDAAAEEIALGAAGLVANLRPGAIHLSCSTISVALSRRLAAAHAAAGQGYVAAPVLGRPEAAAAGKLFILAAGAAKALARCQPLLAALGQRTFVLGDDPALANTAKLVCNFLIASVIESLGEGLALAEGSGIPAPQCVEILTSTLFGAPIYKTYGNLIAEGRFAPAGFKLPLGFKDIRLVLAAAEAVEVPMPIASLVRDHMLAALARGQHDLDWSSFVREMPRSGNPPTS
jgi:3-hydroxyisobutyrate dehydrogenase-like beta-hydroxyacid dehydrogenase